MYWTLLYWLLFAASFVFTFLPVPGAIQTYTVQTWPPLILSIIMSLVINSITIILAFLGIKRGFLNRFMMVSTVFYCGLALTLVSSQVMPRAIVENPEDHISGISDDMTLIAFFLIYFIASLMTLMTFEIGGRWIPALRCQDFHFGRLLFKAIGQVSLVSAIIAYLWVCCSKGFNLFL